ncbi:MAG TPA: helix-turn-helix domain-containing protein [Pilimelia sp.]|nr:helix-turn-helix domain-containing protein [Pilimelia sp.]
MTATAHATTTAGRATAPVPPAAGTPVEAAARPRRGDAARNRERVLAAAREVFAVEGADAQMEHIARHAGVGVGTLYRNFPTKQALIAELGRQFLRDRAAVVEAALVAPDPAAAFEVLIRSTARDMAADTGLCHMFRDLPAEHGCVAEMAGLRSLTAGLLDRAQAVGAVRADLTVDDFEAIMTGLSAAITHAANWELFADMLLAGMRAPTT